MAGPSGLGNVTTNFDDDDDYDSGDDVVGRLNMFYTKTTLAYSTNIQNTGMYSNSMLRHVNLLSSIC